jgi:hypothetical protein
LIISEQIKLKSIFSQGRADGGDKTTKKNYFILAFHYQD